MPPAGSNNTETEPIETMANLTPEQNPDPDNLPYPPINQIPLISHMLDLFEGFAIATDSQGRIVYANPATSRLSGYGQSELAGCSLDTIFELADEQRALIDQCLRDKTAISFETTCIRKAGPTFPVQFKAALLNPETDAHSLVVFAFDISGSKWLSKSRRVW